MQDYIDKYFPYLRSCAIVAPAKKGTALSLKKFDNFKSLVDEYGNFDEDIGRSSEEKDLENQIYNLVPLAKVLFLNNVSSVFCIAPSIDQKPTTQNYIDAFEILKCTSGHYSIVCDSNQPDVISELIKSISDNANFPKIAFVGAPSDNQEAYNLASRLNNPRLIMTSSETSLKSDTNHSSSNLTAAALAASVSTSNSLTNSFFGKNLNGLILKNKSISKTAPTDIGESTLSFLSDRNNNIEIDKLSPLGTLCKQLPANINNLLILDLVVSSVMNLIFEIKKRPSFKYITRSSLISQIMLLLSKHKEMELITDFLIPEITIKTNIRILISIKPETIFNHDYIDYEIMI